MADLDSDSDKDNSYQHRVYEVERIVGHKPKRCRATGYEKGKIQEYFIKWKDYDEDQNTWEDADRIEEQVPESVRRYWYPDSVTDDSGSESRERCNSSSSTSSSSSSSITSTESESEPDPDTDPNAKGVGDTQGAGSTPPATKKRRLTRNYKFLTGLSRFDPASSKSSDKIQVDNRTYRLSFSDQSKLILKSENTVEVLEHSYVKEVGMIFHFRLSQRKGSPLDEFHAVFDGKELSDYVQKCFDVELKKYFEGLVMDGALRKESKNSK